MLRSYGMQICKKMEIGHSCTRTLYLLLFCLVFVLACFWALPLLARTPHQPAKPEVIAYVFKRNDIIQPGEIAAEKLTRINYAFAVIEKGEIVNGYANDDQNLAALVALKRDHP